MSMNYIQFDELDNCDIPILGFKNLNLWQHIVNGDSVLNIILICKLLNTANIFQQFYVTFNPERLGSR